MASINVGARLPEELIHTVDRLAQNLRRPRSWVIEEALRNYVQTESQFLEAVDAGIQDMEAGNVVDHSVIEDDIRLRREARRKAAH